MAFERHSQHHYARRPSWNRGATINGRPAWQVIEERRAAAQEAARGDKG
jgi:hypothetical protein